MSDQILNEEQIELAKTLADISLAITTGRRELSEIALNKEAVLADVEKSTLDRIEKVLQAADGAVSQIKTNLNELRKFRDVVTAVAVDVVEFRKLFDIEVAEFNEIKLEQQKKLDERTVQLSSWEADLANQAKQIAHEREQLEAIGISQDAMAKALDSRNSALVAAFKELKTAKGEK